VYSALVVLDSFGPPGVLSRPLGLHPRTPRAVWVCLCVPTHIHPHTLPEWHPRQKIDTALLSFLMSKISPFTITFSAGTSALHKLGESPHPRPNANEQTAHIRAHMHAPVESVLTNMYTRSST